MEILTDRDIERMKLTEVGPSPKMVQELADIFFRVFGIDDMPIGSFEKLMQAYLYYHQEDYFDYEGIIRWAKKLSEEELHTIYPRVKTRYIWKF